jgi:hypothetical protein
MLFDWIYSDGPEFLDNLTKQKTIPIGGRPVISDRLDQRFVPYIPDERPVVPTPPQYQPKSTEVIIRPYIPLK